MLPATLRAVNTTAQSHNSNLEKSNPAMRHIVYALPK